ncbi:MAG: hypothetical protein IT303_13445 [Dehalococcoidia bacterium]|nr:hypothetical protein [Dehalococcoidia bacterium]
MKRVLLVLVAAFAALLPATAFADGEANDTDGFALRVGGDYHLPAGTIVESLVVIDGDAIVDGRVTDTLFVINGDALIRGSVGGDTTIIRGSLEVMAAGMVDDVSLIRSDLHEHQGARITGDVDRTSAWFWPGGVFLGILFLLGAAVAVMLGGLLFAAVGGRQLATAAASMGQAPGATIAWGLGVALGLPLLAAALMATLIGIPAGLAVLFMGIPVVGYLGYVVAGAWVGMLVLGRTGRAAELRHPFAEVALGLLILQFVAIIPGVAFLAFIVLGTWGAGALARMAWIAARPQRAAPALPATPAAGGLANPT